MSKKNKSEEEVSINLKETLSDFVKTDMPELSQIEAIKAYKEINGKGQINPAKKNDDDATDEDNEHLKRVKHELIEALARVDAMEKRIFEEKNKESIKKVKVKKSSDGGISNKQKNQVLEQMKQRMEDNSERSRE